MADAAARAVASGASIGAEPRVARGAARVSDRRGDPRRLQGDSSRVSQGLNGNGSTEHTVHNMTILEFTLRLALALLLGSIVGLERQYRQRMAGLRTNALVSVGAALFVMLAPLGSAGDPTRIAAQVVSGIGFLAGGVIFREGLSVRGLNTAATLWATAAVGTLAGFGFLPQAAVGALTVMAANVLLRPAVQPSWKVVP